MTSIDIPRHPVYSEVYQKTRGLCLTMFLPESQQLSLGSLLRPLKGGTQQIKSKRSKRLVDKEDTTAIQLSVFNQQEKPSYMPEFQVALKNLTLKHRLTFLSLATPIAKLSQTLEVDSTSKGKVFKPYWNGFSQMMSDWLSLPTKIAYVGLGSILSHGSAIDKNVKFWFSTKRTSAQKEKWLKTYLPLSMSSVAGFTDLESTKRQYVKTVSYRVYPVKALNSIWKKWVGAYRFVYNLSIAYLNQNQNFPKPSKTNSKDKLGGKMGFKKFLKASGLIPQWCVELGISKLLDNSSMEAYSAWTKTKKESSFIGKGKKRKENPNAGKKIAKFKSVRDQRLTLQFDPTAYRNGRWMVSQTKHLDAPRFEGHNFCLLTDGSTELTYNKGRWFAHFPVLEDVEETVTRKVIALDPGVRTFMTGFDGNDFLEFGNGDFSKIAKLCTHLDKLKSKHDLAVGGKNKRLRYKLRVAMERLRTRIKNLRTECHKQTASFLAKNYDVIYLPTFETSQMVVKKSRKLHSKTARAMMTWAFYQFSQTLEHLCNRYGSRLIRVTEEYTSKTCTKCGHIHHKLGSNKHFKCPKCSYKIPRDFNGALGIFLKAMWDTTMIESIDNDHVILDV
jgi:putative transposase